MRITTARRVSLLAGPFRQLSALIAAGDVLRELQGDDIDPLVSCLRDDVPPLRRLRRIAFWVGRDAMAIGEQASSFYEYLNLIFLLDATTMFFGARELRTQGAALLRVIGAVGDVDAALSVAALRADLQENATWTSPRVLPSAPASPATFADLRHPLIDAARAVPNSIALAPSRGVLITGSNMSGKSTFLRTVGVNTVLAQTINTCFASRYEAPIFHVRSCIGRADDLLAGKSYYIAEVEAVLALVRASACASPHLFLFDELFRGTNATERIAAAEAVLRELIDAGRPHVVITATHDAELVELLRDTHDACHFPDALGADGLVFTYRLEPGPSATRNAIALLQLHGAPPALIERELRRAEALDQRVRE
jgi:DNA mismatch repair ATPase MutS